MRRWRKPQQDVGEANLDDAAQPEGAEQQEPAGGNDAGLPGSAGYGMGPLPRNKRRNNMPGTRFTFVRPDGKPD